MAINDTIGLLAITITLLSQAISTSAQVHETQGLYFTENKGQIRDQYGCPREDIQYVLRAPGISIFIGDAQVHYQFYRQNGDSSVSYRMDMSLVHANTGTETEEEGRQAYYENYYISGCMTSGIHVRTCKKIIFKNVYPHIDWALYVNGGKMEQEFIVGEGGDRSQIRMEYNGQTSLNTSDEDGNITATTPLGYIKEHAPQVYTAAGNMLPSSYWLAGNVLSYNMQAYKGALVIDPTLEWGTYYGSDTNVTYLVSVASAKPGNVYAAGWTRTVAEGVVATTGSYQDTYGGGGEDGLLVKFDSSGNRIWGTYYGGSGGDVFNQVTCDTSENIYAIGSTTSADSIATSGTQQPIFGGNGDGFLVRFNSSGVRQWATYCGGSLGDDIESVACDQAGNVIVGGWTQSTNNISTPGSWQPMLHDTNSVFVMKYNSAGMRQWGSYYGTGDEYFVSVCTDNAGNIFLSAQTTGTDSIATSGAFQTVNAGNEDLLLVKFDSTGGRQWGTYYGGSGVEVNDGVTCDASGNVYLAGSTTSTTNIATAGSQQSVYGGNVDAFLVKFSPLGVRRWGTYFGGPGADGPGNNFDYTALAHDGHGHIYICGFTTSDTAIATANGYQTVRGGDIDAFLVEYDTAGHRVWATYYGGTGREYGYSCAPSGNAIYMCGWSKGLDGIATSGSFKPSRSSGVEDGFLAKFTYKPTKVENISGLTEKCIAYPTVNNGCFTITGNSTNSGHMQITIANAAGETIYTENSVLHYGELNKQINLNANIPAGMYLVKVVLPDNVQVLKIIKE